MWRKICNTTGLMLSLFVCLLVNDLSIYKCICIRVCVCVYMRVSIASLYAILFYDGRLRVNMHMEHTFRVSGLVPGILGSLPSPRAKVQAKLASAVTRQRFIRAARNRATGNSFSPLAHHQSHNFVR